MKPSPYCLLSYFVFEGKNAPQRIIEHLTDEAHLIPRLKGITTGFYGLYPEYGLFIDLYSRNANLLICGFSPKGVSVYERKVGTPICDPFAQRFIDPGNENEYVCFLAPEPTELATERLVSEAEALDFICKWLQRENSDSQVVPKYAEIIAGNEQILYSKSVRGTLSTFQEWFAATELFHFFDFVAPDEYLFAKVQISDSFLLLADDQAFGNMLPDFPKPILRIIVSNFEIAYYYALVQGSVEIKQKHRTAWEDTQCIFFDPSGFSWVLTELASERVSQEKLDHDSAMLRASMQIAKPSVF